MSHRALQVGRCAFNHRRAVVCRDAADAASVLSSVDPQRVLTSEQVRRGRPVAFMFPGLGDQYTGMAHELFQFEPAFRAAVDNAPQSSSNISVSISAMLFIQRELLIHRGART